MDQAKLIEVRNAHTVSKDTEPAFWSYIQQAVMLALRDDGILSDVQLWRSEELLRRSFSAYDTGNKL